MENEWKMKLQQLRRYTAATFGAHKLGLALNVLAVADYLKNLPKSLAQHLP